MHAASQQPVALIKKKNSLVRITSTFPHTECASILTKIKAAVTIPRDFVRTRDYFVLVTRAEIGASVGVLVRSPAMR